MAHWLDKLSEAGAEEGPGVFQGTNVGNQNYVRPLKDKPIKAKKRLKLNGTADGGIEGFRQNAIANPDGSATPPAYEGEVNERQSDVEVRATAKRYLAALLKYGKTIDGLLKSDLSFRDSVKKGNPFRIDAADAGMEKLAMRIMFQPGTGVEAGARASLSRFTPQGSSDKWRLLTLFVGGDDMLTIIRQGCSPVLKAQSNTIYHELIHYIDGQRSDGKALARPLKSSKDGQPGPDRADYFNDPSEMQAYLHQAMQTVYHDISKNPQHAQMLGSFGPEKFVGFVIRNVFPLVNDVMWEALSGDNKKKMRQRLASYYMDVIMPEVKKKNAKAMAKHEKTTAAPTTESKEEPVSKTMETKFKPEEPGKITDPDGLHKQWRGKLADGCEVFTVNVKYIRNTYDTDFAGGGHSLAYPSFIPQWEIWIGEEVEDKAGIFHHESVEYFLMRYADKPYEEAHNDANGSEAVLRSFLIREESHRKEEAEEESKEASDEPEETGELDEAAIGRIVVPGKSLTFDQLLKQYRKANGDRTPLKGSREWDDMEHNAMIIDKRRAMIRQHNMANAREDDERSLHSLLLSEAHKKRKPLIAYGPGGPWGCPHCGESVPSVSATSCSGCGGATAAPGGGAGGAP